MEAPHARGFVVHVAGVTQRAVRNGVAAAGRGGGQGGPSHGAYPCFHAVPESQPVLPCLLRRLLQKSKTEARPSEIPCGSGMLHWSWLYTRWSSPVSESQESRVGCKGT